MNDTTISAVFVLIVIILFILLQSRKENYIKLTGNGSPRCDRVGYYMAPEPPGGCASGSFPVGSGYDTEVYGGTPPNAGGCECEAGYGCGIGNTGQIQCLPKCKDDSDCPDGVACCENGQCSIQCARIYKIC